MGGIGFVSRCAMPELVNRRDQSIRPTVMEKFKRCAGAGLQNRALWARYLSNCSQIVWITTCSGARPGPPPAPRPPPGGPSTNGAITPRPASSSPRRLRSCALIPTRTRCAPCRDSRRSRRSPGRRTPGGLTTEALYLGQALDVDTGQLCDLLTARGVYLIYAGCRTEAVAYFRETARLATQNGDHFRQGRALLNLSAVLELTDPAAAAEAARTAIGTVRRAGTREYLATAVLNRVGALIDLGAGIFVLTGHAAAQYAGPGIVYFVHPLRAGLRVCRALLRRIRLNDSAVRLGLHLRLRDARRICRVDHRLEFDPRISFRRRDGCRRLVGLCRFVFEGFARHDSRRVHLRALRSRRASRFALVEHLAIVRARLDRAPAPC